VAKIEVDAAIKKIKTLALQTMEPASVVIYECLEDLDLYSKQLK